MEFNTVIKPKNKLFEVNFKEIWDYRDLFSMFVKRDIITQYKQTVLGPLWFFIQPAITTIMYSIIFGGIAKISTDGLPPFLFYMAGIVCWQYFADCLNKTSSTFTSNQAIFGKVYFPRMIVPLSTVASGLVRMGIQFLLFVVGLWMYATPVIYPLSTMSPKRQWIMALNPVTSLVETFKYGTMGVGTFSWWQLGYSFGFMIVLLGVGIVVFNKVQRSFMDTV